MSQGVYIHLCILADVPTSSFQIHICIYLLFLLENKFTSQWGADECSLPPLEPSYQNHPIPGWGIPSNCHPVGLTKLHIHAH